MALYIAVGLGFVSSRYYSYSLLTWPYLLLPVLWTIAVFTLIGFVGVAYYVYRLKLRLLLQSSAKLGAYVARAGEWLDKTSTEQAIEAVRKDAESRVAAAE